MKVLINPLVEKFHCIAEKCPDSCCKEWDVQVDGESAAKYRALSGALGQRLRQVLKETDGETVMAIENGRCPMWREDGLCQIQAELGESYLCKVCREFPRLTHDYGNFAEIGLELSCPEAARLLLTTAPSSPSVSEISGGTPPEYDKDAMSVLLQTREQAYAILDSSKYSHGQALTLLLLFAYHAQALLDGVEVGVFDPDAALSEAQDLAQPADASTLPSFFFGLEILTEAWRSRLSHPSAANWSSPLRALARYGVERYWLQAVSDYDLTSRVKMILIGCLLVKFLGGDCIETAQLYSKEIENNIDNVDAILDAAYTDPAFTDAKLLWLLRQE